MLPFAKSQLKDNLLSLAARTKYKEKAPNEIKMEGKFWGILLAKTYMLTFKI